MQGPISFDPDVMHGTPCFRGTRVPVASLFQLLAKGRTLDYFLGQFPTVRREDAVLVLDLATDSLLARQHPVPAA
jgi:uncharacterized protein (DUF433 family)